MQGTPIRLSRPITALLTTMLAVSGLPSLSASGSNNPEIMDDTGDTTPSAFFTDTDENQPAFENFTAYDLEKVYVLLETATDLLVQFQVRDLPDRWAFAPLLPDEEGFNASAPGPNASQPSVVLAVNFTLRGASHEAMAILSQPTGQGLRDTYSISRDGSAPVAVSGSYDVAADTVTLALRKDLLGSPRNGDILSDFRAEGRFGDAKLDFAPDAVDYEPQPGQPDLITIVLEKLQGQQVVQPQFGNPYTFNYRAGSGDVELSAAATTATVGPGGMVVYSVQVKNRGAAADTIILTLSDPSLGYHHRLGLTELDLAPGHSEIVLLTVSTAASARGTAISIVEARSRLGDTEALVFETSIVEGAPVSTTGSSNPIEQTNAPNESPETADDPPFNPTRKRTTSTPGFEAVAVGMALVALAAWWPRRP